MHAPDSPPPPSLPLPTYTPAHTPERLPDRRFPFLESHLFLPSFFFFLFPVCVCTCAFISYLFRYFGVNCCGAFFFRCLSSSSPQCISSLSLAPRSRLDVWSPLGLCARCASCCPSSCVHPTPVCDRRAYVRSAKTMEKWSVKGTMSMDEGTWRIRQKIYIQNKTEHNKQQNLHTEKQILRHRRIRALRLVPYQPPTLRFFSGF